MIKPAIVASLGLLAFCCLATSLSAQPLMPSLELAQGANPIAVGNAYRREGKYKEALEVFQKYLQQTLQSGDLDGQWVARTFVAETYKDLREFQKAIELHEENLAFAKAKGNELAGAPRGRELASLESLSGVYTVQGNYQKAIELQRQVLAVRETEDSISLGKPKLLEELGMNLFHAGNLAEAETTLRTAIKAYDIARESRLKPLLAAGADLSTSQFLLEFEFSVDVYRWLQKVLVAQNKTDAALEVAEQGRARALTALLEGRLGVPPTSLPVIPPLNLEQIKQVAKEKNATLVTYSVIYKYDPSRAARIIFGYDFLETDEVYIWVVKPTGEITFRRTDLKILDLTLKEVVERSRVAAATGQDRAAPTATLANAVTDTRDSLGIVTREAGANPAVASNLPAPESRRNFRRLRQLYQFLIAPIETLLPTDPKAPVIFILQDSLFFIPFPALQDATGKYLIEKHTILTAPSVQILDLTRKQRQRLQNQTKEVLVVGNPHPMPVYGNPPTPLSSLPGAEKEAQNIATLFRTQPLVGPQATKTTAIQRMSQARIIHLATHGILDRIDTQTIQFLPSGTPVRGEAGLEGSLAFVPSGDNGFLTAREILGLNLSAELVVLSACNTGRGAVRGDGVIGLSRAFIQAGVPSIIVSMWLVPDEATSFLMKEFYQNLQRHPNKAQALREAMLATLKQFPEPKEWAAFTLIGETE